jgi:parallel beta-helix repeat protein
VPRFALLLGLALVFSASAARAGGLGPFGCPDRTPLAITAPGEPGEKCQTAIAKEGAKYAKTKAKTLGKCALASGYGACPTAADTTKIEKAAVAASDKIAKACADDAAQAALGTSYAGMGGSETTIASCSLSQQSAAIDILVANATGASTAPLPEDEAAFPGFNNKARTKCIKQAHATGVNFATSALAAMSACIEQRIKKGPTDGIQAACIGSFAGNVFTPPTDAKTASKIAKLVEKSSSAIDKKCAPGASTWLPSVSACGGSLSAVELARCLMCDGWNHAVDLVEHQYGEAGVLVTPAVDAIQDAVTNATTGTKLLVASGNYPDPVVIDKSGIAIVGCGAATNDRPRIERADAEPDPNRGIESLAHDDLHFQSLEVVDWNDDGIFVSGAVDVSFRDVIGDGDLNSTYAIFPVESEGVRIEGCVAREVADAGLYVGSSEGIVVRYNRIEANVAGLEIENSIGAFVHNNTATGNTGGILVFKLPGPVLQESRDHVISHNVSVENNIDNFAQPGSTVSVIPPGTGFLILSNDDTTFEWNRATGNRSVGFLMIDQAAANLFSDPPAFPVLSPDQKSQNNLVEQNVFTGNGLDPEIPIGAGDIAFVLGEPGDPLDHGNCFQNNVAPETALVTASQCP